MSKIKINILLLIACLLPCLSLAAIITERSLVIVMDRTSSMTNAISEVKQAAKEMFTYLSAQEKNRFVHYVLRTFTDPDVDSTFATTSSADFLSKLNAVSIHKTNKNTDCPEPSLNALHSALSQAKPNSYVFLFTDDPPSDTKKENAVIDLIKSKKIKLNIFRTEGCEQIITAADRIFDDLVLNGGGQVFKVTEESIGTTMKTFIPELHIDYGDIAQITEQKPQTRTFYIDDTVDKIQFKVTGRHPILQLFDPKNKQVLVNVTVSETETLIGEIPNPAKGKWTFTAMADSTYTVNIGAASKIDYQVEIVNATNPDGTTSDEFEIMVKKPDGIDVGSIIAVKIIKENADKSVHSRTLPLNECENITDTYCTGLTEKPKSSFQIVVQSDKNGTTQEKTSYSEIKTPEKFDNDIIDVVEGTRVQLSCAESSSPTVWTFKGKTLTNSGTKSNQLTLSNVDKINSGIYNCKSSSNQKELKVKVVDAPKIDPQCNVDTIEVGDKCALMCFYESSKSTNVTWLDDEDKILISDDQTYTINVTKETMDQRIRCKVKTENFESTTPEFTLRTYNENDDIKLFEVVEGMNLMMNCVVPNIKPTSIVTWTYKNAIVKGPETDPKLEIDEIKRVQYGTYSCRVVTGSEVVKKSYVVTVISQPKIEVSTKLKSITGIMEATLKCSYESSKTASVQWMDEDLKILQNGGDVYKMKHFKFSKDKTIFCQVKTTDFLLASTVISYPHD